MSDYYSVGPYSGAMQEVRRHCWCCCCQGRRSRQSARAGCRPCRRVARRACPRRTTPLPAPLATFLVFDTTLWYCRSIRWTTAPTTRRLERNPRERRLGARANPGALHGQSAKPAGAARQQPCAPAQQPSCAASGSRPLAVAWSISHPTAAGRRRIGWHPTLTSLQRPFPCLIYHIRTSPSSSPPYPVSPLSKRVRAHIPPLHPHPTPQPPPTLPTPPCQHFHCRA